MQDAFVSAADDLVGHGIAESGVPLTETLRHYLAITLARYMRAHVALDRLSFRYAGAVERGAPVAELRELADNCLMACSIFEARLRRRGGHLTHYMGLGASAYDAAEMTEQAWGFPHMRDVVLAATSEASERRLEALIDAARAGSTRAAAQLSGENVVTFPAKRWIQ